MPFKFNIAMKDGKTYKLEADATALEGKELGNKIKGEEVSSDLAGYEFKIAGASDKVGFTAMKDVDGIGTKKVMLTYGKGMKKKPKREGKIEYSNNNPGGLKLRKTVRGKIISPAISQINLIIIKEGAKKLAEIYPDQNKAKIEENASPDTASTDNPSPEDSTDNKPEAPKEPVPEKEPAPSEGVPSDTPKGTSEGKPKEEKQELAEPDKE
jgi:small subunit ribosomal protein S6e